MLFNTRMILGYVIAALTSVPVLTIAATLGDNTALASASPDDLPTPKCRGESTTLSCNDYIATFCNGAHQIQVKAGDTQHHCYSVLGTQYGDYNCYFSAHNTNNNAATATPSAANCQKVLKNIASYCHGRGGSGRYSSKNPFTFGVVSKQGKCPEPA